MNDNSNVFLKLLSFALTGLIEKDILKQEINWFDYFQFCEQQGIIGVGLKSIEQVRSLSYEKIPSELILEWIGTSEIIRNQNELLNNRCIEIASYFEKERIRYCILKGQGNATMYPTPNMRTPGDIDVWLEGSKKEIVKYIHQRYPQMNVQYHHMNYPLFDDVEVEVHYYPSFCYNKWHNYKLQQFFVESSTEQFQHFIEFGDKGRNLCVPTLEFNLVFQLSHMIRHFFTQGIGLRHAVDYFYLLQQDISKEEKQNAVAVMKRCGMYKFLQAIMWIELSVFGLKNNIDIAPSNEKAGKLVLREMIKGGNFGMLYERGHQSTLFALATEMVYTLNYIKEFPSEPLSRPFSLIWDFVKKRTIKFG